MTSDPPVIEAVILEKEGEKEIAGGNAEKNEIRESSLLKRQAAQLMLFIKWAKPS